MTILKNTSLKVSNFKCFGEEPQGFDTFEDFNILIGRNNAGKSSLIDLLKFAHDTTNGFRDEFNRPGTDLTLEIGTELTAPLLDKFFRAGRTSNLPTPFNSDQEFAEQFVGKIVPVKHTRTGQKLEISPVILPEEWNWLSEAIRQQISAHLNAEFKSIFPNLRIQHLAADRDIFLEGSDPGSLDLKSNGRGATNIVRAFFTADDLNSEFLEDKLLSSLNKIYFSDNIFSAINCKESRDTRNWEIHLREQTKGRDIRLSESGSGLKTVLLILIHLHLIQELQKLKPQLTLFALEEIENNLHPALLRRLLQFLWEWQEKNKATFFISTHSNVLIDWFSKKDNAQIIHVTHDGTDATCAPATSYMDNKEILDDLDFRASDILQANGIIWVEGPSDRIYLKRWIEIWSDGELQEGTHYQILIYGGLLLNHFEALPPDETENRISLLTANRNCAVIMDSDCKPGSADLEADLNETKQRIRSEVESSEGFVWITAGKEIENYVHRDIWREFLEQPKLKTFPRCNSVFKKKELKKYAAPKQKLAHELKPHFTLDNMADVLDLGQKLNRLCSEIRRWNGFEKDE